MSDHIYPADWGDVPRDSGPRLAKNATVFEGECFVPEIKMVPNTTLRISASCAAGKSTRVREFIQLLPEDTRVLVIIVRIIHSHDLGAVFVVINSSMAIQGSALRACTNHPPLGSGPIRRLHLPIFGAHFLGRPSAPGERVERLRRAQSRPCDWRV